MYFLAEMFSLMKPIGDIIIVIAPQAASYHAEIDTFIALCMIQRTVLHHKDLLVVQYPSIDVYDAELLSVQQNLPNHLKNLTKKLFNCF